VGVRQRLDQADFAHGYKPVCVGQFNAGIQSLIEGF